MRIALTIFAFVLAGYFSYMISFGKKKTESLAPAGLAPESPASPGSTAPPDSLPVGTPAIATEILKLETIGNDTGQFTFILKSDRTFRVEGAFFQEDEETGGSTNVLGPGILHSGTFREDLNTYDLQFQTETAESVKNIFKGSLSTFIPSTGAMRINKDAKDIYIYQILMEKSESK